MVTTSPLCRSRSEMGRAPKRIAKTAIAAAKASAVLPLPASRGSTLPSSEAMFDTTLICAAMSGIAAASMPAVTSAPTAAPL